MQNIAISLKIKTVRIIISKNYALKEVYISMSKYVPRWFKVTPVPYNM
jgi:hypothetical protein